MNKVKESPTSTNIEMFQKGYKIYINNKNGGFAALSFACVFVSNIRPVGKLKMARQKRNKHEER